MPKKNSLGFTKGHLKLLLNYCIATRKKPRMPHNEFHRKYSYYFRKKSTAELINKGYERKAIADPMLYANIGFDVTILNNVDNLGELLKECEEDPKTKFALALRGELSFIRFRRGPSTLSFYQNIIPNFYSDSDNCIENLNIEEKGKLPRDPYPHGWSEEHWAIYEVLRFPRRKTFREVGKELELHWETVKKYYTEVLGQCKVLTSFFPLGNEGYSYQVVTFKTKYEVGVLRALKKLNRTSYLYKAEDTIILGLFLEPIPRAYENSADRFVYLEEIGMIHDLHVSIPLDYHQENI